MIRNSIFLLLFLLTGFSANAAKRYWVAASASTWNSTANWSSTSGGAGGFSVPTGSDTAYFDGNGTGNDTLDVNVSVMRLEIAAGYTGTIVQGTYTVTIGSSGAVLSGGTFAGGSGSITASGAFTISGCAFTSTNGTFSTSANFTVSSGSFAHNNGKLSITATMTLTSSITGGTTYYDLEFAPTATNPTVTITSTTTLTVSDTLSIAGTKYTTFTNGTIHLHGTLTTANASVFGGSGSTTIVFDGTGNQSLIGNPSFGTGRLPNIQVNKSSGTLSLSGVISIHGNWTYTTGTVSEGTSVVVMYGSPTISGGPVFNTVSLIPGGTFTIASGTIMTVKGTLYYAAGGPNCPIINTGTIYAQGNINLSACTQNTGTGGTGTIEINGTGNQTFTGSTGGSGRVCSITINKSSGTLYLASHITSLGNWTYTAGTLDAGTSTVSFANTKTISGTHTLNRVTFFGGSTGYTYKIATGTILTADSTLTISGSAQVKLDTGTVYAKDDINITNTSSSTGGSATIVINGDGAQALTGSGTARQGSLPNVIIDKTSGTLTMNSIISVSGNWTYTQGTVDPGTSSIAFYGTFNLDGQGTSSTMPFYRVGVSGNTRTLTGNLDVNDNLTISSGATLVGGTYTLTVGGNWNSQGTWTYNTSTVVIDGGGDNQVSGASGLAVDFYNLTFDHRSGYTTFSRAVTINHNMTLTKGRIITTSTNVLSFIDTATCTTANDSAYVHGPVRKTGNDAFTFPLGDTALHDSIAYHPLAMTAPGVNTDQFEAYYRAAAQTQGDSLVDSLARISSEEYWTFERKAGSSNVTVTLAWNKNSDINDVGSLRVAAWNGTMWLDYGQSISSISWPTGSVTSSVAINFPLNPITITTGVYLQKYKAYATVKRKLDGGFYETNNHSIYFRFDDEYNDQNHSLSYKVYNSANTNVAPTLISNTNNSALSYYGDNRFRLDLYTSSGALSSGYYILEVTNEKNEKFFLRFYKP